MACKRRSREEQMARYDQDESLPVFSTGDRVHIMAHANAWGADAVDYLQQLEEEVRVLFEKDSTEIDMLNTVEKLLAVLPLARKTP